MLFRSDGTHTTAQYVKGSFTAISSVACPGSRDVCDGCVACLNESADIVVGHEHRTAQKIRNYSWILSSRGAVACTKGQREVLLHACLHPPEPPYAIVIAVSGQRQLLYRGVVCWSQDLVTVSLEEERITYQPPELLERLELLRQIVSLTGKPALEEGLSVHQQCQIVEQLGEEAIQKWDRVARASLSRLALFLLPKKEERLNVRFASGE